MSGWDPSKIPLESAPEGQTNNLIDPPSQAWIARVSIYTTLPVAIGFLVLRYWARLRYRLAFSWDDYFCLAAGIFTAAYDGVMLSNVVDDMYGRHYWDVPLSAITSKLMKQTFSMTLLYCVASALTKICLCCFFYRIFLPSTRSKIMIWVGIILTTVSYIAFGAAWTWASVPHEGEGGWAGVLYWTRAGRQTPKISVGLGAVGTFTDFYIISIPLLAISSLNMSRSKKFGVSALFATGLLACGFSAAGLASRLSNYRATLVFGRPDPFWSSMSAYGLAVAEINLGIVCACVPAVFPLFKSLAETSTTRWYSWRQYRLKYRTPSKSVGSTTGGTDDISATQRGLPRVPKGHLNTLFSFVRGSDSDTREEKSQGNITVTQETDIEMARYSELNSVDMANLYHSHLYREGSQRNLVGNFADVQRQ